MFNATPEIVSGWTNADRAKFFNGISRTSAGIETYERPVGPEVVQAMSRQGDHLKNYFVSCLYRLRPKPSPEDVISIGLEPGAHYSKLKVTIRRGHYELLDFFKHHAIHGGFSIQLGAQAVVVCNCGRIEILDARSIR